MILKKFKYKKISSTNDVAVIKIKQGYRKGIVVSDVQTKGKGQYGKSWVSSKGNLFLSVFYIINKKIQISSLIKSNLRIIKKILSRYTKSNIKIKSPNDIMINKKKICGILNETLFYGNLKFIVIGIGINISNSPNLRDYPTTFLNEITKKKISKIEIFNQIVRAFEVKIKWLLLEI